MAGMKTSLYKACVLAAALLCWSARPSQAEKLCAAPIESQDPEYPVCSRWCAVCIDNNDAFAHNCGSVAMCCRWRDLIDRVFACTLSPDLGCGNTSSAQDAWIVFLKKCARVGAPVSRADTPPGYIYVDYSSEGKFGCQPGEGSYLIHDSSADFQAARKFPAPLRRRRPFKRHHPHRHLRVQRGRASVPVRLQGLYPQLPGPLLSLSEPTRATIE